MSVQILGYCLEVGYSLVEVCFVVEQVFPGDVEVVVVFAVLVVDDFVEVLVVEGGFEVVVDVLVFVVFQRKNFLCFRKIHHFEELPLLSITGQGVL